MEKKTTPNPSDIMSEEQRQEIVNLLNQGILPVDIFCYYFYPLEWAIQVLEELNNMISNEGIA